MSSKTALDLVNEVLVLTGDYSKLTTVVGSPADIAERIINFLNITLQDLSRFIDFHDLQATLTGTGNGTDSVWQAATGDPALAREITSVTVDKNVLEYVTPAFLQNARATILYSGQPRLFTSTRLTGGELAVDIYPTPGASSVITVTTKSAPVLFTLTDTSTTNITGIDDALVIGALMHLDAYDGLNRGYAGQYKEIKARLFTDMYSNKQIRVTPEDYH